MVKAQAKSLITDKNLVNHTSNTPTEYNQPKKSRQEINREYYQKNKEKHQKRYQQQKAQQAKSHSTSYNYSHYSQVSDYKVLMSFKEYIELNKEKHKLWLDFNWTLKDCQGSIKEGYADATTIMKLEQVASKLVRDYWDTAKSELKNRSRSWNSLTEEQQDRLIKYWGQEKARWEYSLSHSLERQEERGKDFEKEIKEMIGISFFHEERGLIKCQCWKCEEKKSEGRELLGIKEPKGKRKIKEKDYCSNCENLRVLNEEGICKSCENSYDI